MHSNDYIERGSTPLPSFGGITAVGVTLTLAVLIHIPAQVLEVSLLISRCYVVAMFDITTNALQTVRYQMPGAVAVRYLARYRTAIPKGN